MLNHNRFDDCKVFFAAHAERDNKMNLLHCYLSFVQAASSHAEGDLLDALTLIWGCEKKAAAQKNVEGKLIQGDTHFLAALVQIIQQKYLKAALNMRKSFNYYHTAHKELQTYKGLDREELLGWSAFGNGFFNLVLSFLPPTVLTVAQWTGYGGDREAGLRLLHQSQSSSSFMAPFACLLLLAFYVNVPSLTGEPEDEYLDITTSLFDWALKRYPEGALFLVMQSRACRCKRDLDQAIQLAKRAIRNCRELPSIGQLLHWNTGWCTFFLLEWQQSAHYFDQLLHTTPSGAYIPPPGFDKFSEEEKKMIESEEKDGDFVRMPPAKASARTFYACMCGINYLLLSHPHKARWYFSLVPSLMDNKSKKPIDLYAKRKAAEYLTRPPGQGDRKEDALLDACELLLTWNGASQMPMDRLKKMVELLEAAQRLNLPYWKIEQHASIYLYKADMYRGMGEYDMAQQNISIFLQSIPALSSSSKIKADGTLAFGYYTAAFLSLQKQQIQQASDLLKQGQKISGYDQYNQMQVRMHALGEMLKKKKAALGIK